MKKKVPALTQRYLRALSTHLDTRRPGGSGAARGLGRDLVHAGCNAVDLARMHGRALAELAVARAFDEDGPGRIRRAENFLTEALGPAEQVQRSSRESIAQLQRRAETLHRKTAVLAADNRQLKREVQRHKAGEAAVKQGREHYHLLFVQSQLVQKKLRRLARQILSAQEEERREISRELHDEVVQNLVGINVELTALGKAASIGARALKSRIVGTQRLVVKSVSAVHRFARELRPAVLDDLGLIPAIHAYMKTVANRRHLKIRLTAAAGVEALDNARRTVLYRVAQEALTNVARHAQASVVEMAIREIPGAIRLEVHDNGRSFPVVRTLSAKSNKRIGLLGMRERVEMVGGALTIESAPGAGTTVRAEIPFNPGAAA